MLRNAWKLRGSGAETYAEPVMTTNWAWVGAVTLMQVALPVALTFTRVGLITRTSRAFLPARLAGPALLIGAAAVGIVIGVSFGFMPGWVAGTGTVAVFGGMYWAAYAMTTHRPSLGIAAALLGVWALIIRYAALTMHMWASEIRTGVLWTAITLGIIAIGTTIAGWSHWSEG
jgi:hypothetical protein